MRLYSLSQISKMKNISDYLYDENKNFTPEKLITDLGLYEGVLIDTSNVIWKSTKSHEPYPGKDYTTINEVLVSKDVQALHRFMLFKESIMLPCAECRRDQAFSPNDTFNPQQLDSITLKDNDGVEVKKTIILPIDRGEYPIGTSTIHRVFEPLQIIYRSGRDEMSLNGNQVVSENKIDTKQAALSCVEGISQFFSEIRCDFVCSLDKSHHVTAYYIIHKATDVCKKYGETAEYEKLKYYLVLEKVGQEPSMADLQMFDIEKYKKVLSDDRFRDFSMALGLYASGVGCGALLYLRRIFESIVEGMKKECESAEKWNDQEYGRKRFNEKIEYIETFGKKIIPDILSDVKEKIYGWLSIGVHELSEKDSKELFPYLKYSIELILDEQLMQKEKADKLKELKKKLNI